MTWYGDFWGNLRGIRLQGTMDVLREGAEYNSANRLLMRKFPQFRTRWDDKENAVMKLTSTRATSWRL